MSTIQVIFYAVVLGFLALMIMSAFFNMFKPQIIKIYKKYMEGKKNGIIKQKETGSGSSNSTDTTGSKQPDTNNTGRIQRFETNNGEQQSVGSEHKSAEQTKQYKSIFE